MAHRLGGLPEQIQLKRIVVQSGYAHGSPHRKCNRKLLAIFTVTGESLPK